MSSSVHLGHKNKDSLANSEGPTQGLDDTTLTKEAMITGINESKVLTKNIM